MFDRKSLGDAIRYEGGVSRRLFLAYAAALSSLPLLGRASSAQPAAFSSNPFSLGVASGDPDSSSVVLWTRLAPKPLEPFGGMPPNPVPVPVTWEIAEDDSFKKVVASKTALATPQLGHSVHVEAKGLKPDRWYFYRFRTGDAESPVGRTRTMPLPDATADRLQFAFASCQHFERGLFTAYDQMARDDLDLILHLGDYIYEDGAKEGQVRQHVGNEIQSLADYRIRHAQYRSDLMLQAAHARCPWFVTWDDHEVDNNYANAISEHPNVDPVDFLIRRANAYQAYYEMMPLRGRSLPKGHDMQLYRKASFGRLAELLVLDTRQYRTDQPNGDGSKPLNEAALYRGNTILGAAQSNWLRASLLQSDSTWNVLAQQVMMGMVGRAVDGNPTTYSMDKWTGYAWERMELMRFLAERRIPNPVVLTGDIHSNWVNDLRVDDRVMETDIVATEFVGTSISSGGNGVDRLPSYDQLMSENPFVRFHNVQRGYVRCTVTPKEWVSDYLVVDQVTEPGGKVTKRAGFAIEAGAAGAKPV